MRKMRPVIEDQAGFIPVSSSHCEWLFQKWALFPEYLPVWCVPEEPFEDLEKAPG